MHGCIIGYCHCLIAAVYESIPISAYKPIATYVYVSKRERNIVVLIPDAAQLHEPERQAVNRFVAKTCREIGVPFVDVTKKLEKEEDPRTLYLFPFDAHTSPKGHRLIAESIFKQIEI